MIIEFLEVSGKNFMSVGNTPIKLKLDTQKNILIKGTNGSGKSTSMNMITFALFGRSYSKATKTSLVNSVNNKACEVELSFRIDTDTYKVIRGQKPNKFEIYKNDVLIEQSSASKDYQQILEDIIKLDFKTYCQCIMLGSMSYVPFLELTTADRRAFVENLLDIDAFTKMSKTLKLMVQENQNKIIEATSNVNSTKKSIDVISSVIENLESNNLDKIEELNTEIKSSIETYKLNEADYNELVELNSKLIVDDQEVLKLKNNIKTLDTAISTKNSDNTRLKSKIQFFEKTPECSQCGQVVDEKHKEKHIKEYEDEITNNLDLISKAENKKQQFQDQLDEFDKISTQKTKVQQDINTLKVKLEYLKKEVTNKNLEKKKLESSDSNNILVEQKSKLVEEEKTLELQQNILDSLLLLKSKYDKIAVSLKDSGAKAEIIKNYVPVITALVNKYLEKLNLYVKFNLDGEFNETLKSRHTDEFQYHSFSMGERTRINFAMLFAWWEITKIRKGINFNIVCADEVLENLDDEGMAEILSVITEIPNLGSLVVTHKSSVDILFDDIITAQKVKGFTRLIH